MRCEIETTIRWDAEDNIAYIWTNDAVVIRKLDSLCRECPDIYTKGSTVMFKSDREEMQCRYSVHKRFIGFKKPRNTANMSEEQRRAVAERLRNTRKKKGQNN